MTWNPTAATADTFTFTHDTGATAEVRHKLYDIPLPRSTMSNITLTANGDGSATYAFDYEVHVDDGYDEETLEPINPRNETRSASHVISAEHLATIVPPPPPKFIVYTQAPGDPAEQPLIDAIAFSHAVRCRWGDPTLPQTDRDAPYMFHIRPGTTGAAVVVPERMQGFLTEAEQALLVDNVEGLI